MNSRYAKFLVALAGAVVTILGVLIEQNLNLVPAEWQPWVLLAWQVLIALGVRQTPNTPPRGENRDPDVSETAPGR